MCIALGTGIVTLVLKHKEWGELTKDLRTNGPILYFVIGWITTSIGTRINAYKYYGWNKKKINPTKDVSIYMLLWSIPVLIISFIFNNTMNFVNVFNNKYILILYILPFIYAGFIVWLFNRFNRKHSWKINDMNEYGESHCADIYNEVFESEFHFTIFIVLAIIMKFCIDIPDYIVLIPAFIISKITMLLVEKGMREVRFSKGPDGKLYKIRTSSHGLDGETKTKRVKATTFNWSKNWSTTTYSDEEGNKTTIDHWKF